MKKKYKIITFILAGVLTLFLGFGIVSAAKAPMDD